MRKRQEEADRRRIEKAQRKAYEKLCAKQNAEMYSKVQAKETAALRAEQSTDSLLAVGEVLDERTGEVRPATTHAEEKESALTFAAALGIESPIVYGATTLRDLLSRVLAEWHRQGRPLLNPFSKKFSNAWDYSKTSADTPSLDSVWKFIPPVERYDDPIAAPVVATSAAQEQPPEAKPTAAAQFEEWRKGLGKFPPTYFSGVVIPHEGEE